MCSVGVVSDTASDQHLIVVLRVILKGYQLKKVLVLGKSKKSKKLNFSKVWGAASIGDAATIRNFKVITFGIWSFSYKDIFLVI